MYLLRTGNAIYKGSIPYNPRPLHNTNRRAKTLSEHSDHINSVSVSPNNQLLASGSDDKSLKLWDLKAGKAIISIPHPQKIYAVCFSPDGNYIATACQDKIVRVYGTSELQSLAS